MLLARLSRMPIIVPPCPIFGAVERMILCLPACTASDEGLSLAVPYAPSAPVEEVCHARRILSEEQGCGL